ncbi:FAD-dependent monooxygenase [Streptomyces sp. BBFR2]|uniref:FAD-dependent monooxygenase n=1 Tax=Streptomyces sp. BBFR2 TaxID=3372854 RepID=UPI0037D9E13D
MEQGSAAPSGPGPVDAQAEVLVVGAGPTGLLLAGDLAEAGVRVTLLERRPETISNLTRALVVHARTLEQFDARGLADTLVAVGHPLRQLRLFGGVTVDASRLRSRFPLVLAVPQYEVERLLIRRAREAGVTFRYDSAVEDVRQTSSEVTVRVRDAEGVHSLRAAYLVGTDGAHSTVRTALGVPFPGRSVLHSLILADVRLAQSPPHPFSLKATRDAVALIGSFGDGWYRITGWSPRHQPAEDTPADLDEVRTLTRLAFGTDYGMHDARWISRIRSDERQAPSYRVGRAFLAGDAAHVHSPAGGQGMNTGLQDAANLSWKLAAVLRGRAPESLLDSYQAERHPVGAAVLRTSGALLRLAQLRTPPQRAARAAVAQVVNHVPPIARGAVRRLSGLALAYPAPRTAHPLTGRRAPDLHLADDNRLYALLRRGTFVLITPPGETPDAPSDRLTTASWRSDRRTALLVRPDGYIAWADDATDPATRAAALRDALQHWTGASLPTGDRSDDQPSAQATDRPAHHAAGPAAA